LQQIESGKWQIIDLQGKVLQQYITPANNNMGITFEIKDYPTGLYIVRYENKQPYLASLLQKSIKKATPVYNAKNHQKNSH
jgi:ABC-type uncharacterized transport system substrate-binding protein